MAKSDPVKDEQVDGPPPPPRRPEMPPVSAPKQPAGPKPVLVTIEHPDSLDNPFGAPVQIVYKPGGGKHHVQSSVWSMQDAKRAIEAIAKPAFAEEVE